MSWSLRTGPWRLRADVLALLSAFLTLVSSMDPGCPEGPAATADPTASSDESARRPASRSGRVPDLAAHLRLDTSSRARPEAVLQGEHWRITVLSAGLVRIEWSDDGAFEDRASTFAVNRDLPVPEFSVVEGDAALELVTDRLRLTYDRGPFTPAGLSVQARGNVSNYHSVWRYGDEVSD